MRCRIVNVMMNMMLDVQRTGQDKNTRWNENWTEIARRHPEVDGQDDIGARSGHFTLCLELLGLWSDVVYAKFDEVIDMHDIMQLEMIISAAYLAGQDSTSSKMFSDLMQRSETEEGNADANDDAAGPD